jgi:hypothetical protein
MENMSFIFLIIIVIYLLYALFKSRSEKVQKEEVKMQAKEEKIFSSVQEKNKDTEMAAIAAAIAAVMGDTNYIFKRVYAVAKVNERNSSWRNAGRNETMKKN